MGRNFTYTARAERTSGPFRGLDDDEDDDKGTYDWIQQQLALGNDWAWCVVTVTATDPETGASRSVERGPRIYESAQAFRSDIDGEWSEMTELAAERLTASLSQEQLAAWRASALPAPAPAGAPAGDATPDTSRCRHPDLEFHVDVDSGTAVRSSFDEAVALAVVRSVSNGTDVCVDVVCWSRAAAVAYAGDAGGSSYDEDPDASVFERIVVRAQSLGRIA